MPSRKLKARDDKTGRASGAVRRRVPDAPKFGPHIDKLLKAACAESTPDVRSELDSRLQEAWMYCEMSQRSRQRSPREDKDLKQLKGSLKKTQNLLRRLRTYWVTRDIGFDTCPVGDGTISIATVRELQFGGTLDLPRNPPPFEGFPEEISHDAALAAVNVERLLSRLLCEIDRIKRKPWGQRKPGQFAAVYEAARFFAEYSTVAMTTYSGGEFVEFCELFYSVVTQDDVKRGGLAAQIKKVVRDFNHRK